VRIQMLVIIIVSSWLICPFPKYVYAQADPKDIQQAEKLLSGLPPAYKGSQYSVSRDGTVIIRVLCIGESRDKSMDGEIHIKDGLVKKVR